MSGKGGARHHTKPWVDQGLLYAALVAHQDLVKDLGRYEHISRSNAPDPKGGHALPGLVEGTCESGALWRGSQPTTQAGPAQPLVRIHLLEHHKAYWWCLVQLEARKDQLLVESLQEAQKRREHVHMCLQADK